MLDTVDILTLLAVPKIGRKTVQSVLDTLTDPPSYTQELRDVLLDAKKKNARISIPTTEELQTAQKKAESILEASERQGVTVMVPTHSKFPRRLWEIPDPPVVLYAKGNLDCLFADKSIAVVGAREPTPYGRKCAERFSTLFAEKGFVVVSGLAKGCDTAVHQGCLSVKGRTVAILAHGLDTVFPTENLKLAQQILDMDGCLVSEYPIGLPPRRHFVVERDRLQIGLSDALIVVETDMKGGTMHTAKFCIDQHKPLGCLVHPRKWVAHDKSRGNHHLIRENKAVPLKDASDIENFTTRLSSHFPNTSKSFATPKALFRMRGIILSEI